MVHFVSKYLCYTPGIHRLFISVEWISFINTDRVRNLVGWLNLLSMWKSNSYLEFRNTDFVCVTVTASCFTICGVIMCVRTRVSTMVYSNMLYEGALLL